MLTYDDITALTDNRSGQHDVPCPECGPDRLAKANRERKVLRVWQTGDFATYLCMRCGLKGHSHDRGAEARPRDPVAVARTRAEATRRDADNAAERHRIARYLWDRSGPAEGTIVVSYLRARSIEITQIPATLRYLPSSPPKHPFPAMITAFGMPDEPAPGTLALPVERLMGVHLTFLRPDGRGKANTEPAKIMIGRSVGMPIVLAPPYDGLGLAIGEGVETMLSVHIETGLAVWAAGAAGRMPALADKVPEFIEAVTIAAEGDPAGQRGAGELAERLAARGIEVRMAEATHGA